MNCLLLPGCRTSRPSDLQYLEIPWGSTREQSLSILGYREDESARILAEADGIITIYDKRVFGEPAVTQKFYFDKSHSTYHLYRVEITYSETADMENVCKELTNTYGKPAGQEEIFISTGGEYQLETLTTTENHKLWISGQTFAAGDPKTEAVKRAYWEEHLPYLQTDTDWEQFVQSSCYTFIWLTKDGILPRYTPTDISANNRVIFYAENYVIDNCIMPWQETVPVSDE